MQPGEPGQQDAPVPRTCEACGAPMEAGQDWCLECGTAAPGRLGSRPGMRAAATVVAMTLALVGGAVAASYAALSGDASEEAGKPAPPSGAPIAQAPPNQTTTPPGAVPGLTGPNPETLTTPTVPQTGTPTTPGTTTTPTIPQIPNIPSSPSSPSTSSPTPNIPQPTPDSSPESGSGGSGGSGGPGGSGGSGGSGGGTKTQTTPRDTGPQPIALDADAARLYDPSNRAIRKGDPAKAVDDDPRSNWFVTTAQNGRDMAVGLLLDLKTQRGVRVLELATSTPGFRVEIYASDSDELPPDILDTRWAHITDRSNVDETAGKDRNKQGDGKERIVLGGGSAKYRYVLLWLTTPAEDGPTVRISDVDLSG